MEIKSNESTQEPQSSISTPLSDTLSTNIVRIQGTDILVNKPIKHNPIPLEEDEYIQGIATIIQRDFFPSLNKMRLQNQFLEAVDSSDLIRARSIGTQLARATTGQSIQSSTPSHPSYNRTPSHTPKQESPNRTPQSVRETPTSYQSTPISSLLNENHQNQPSYNTNMSLDNFQTNYTSEDNASFNEIMEKSMEERRMKYRWVYDAETRRLTLDKPDSMLLEDGKMKVNPHGFIEEWKYIAKNPLMYYPDASPMDAPPSHYTGEVKSINHSGTRLKSHDVTRMNIGEITSIERQRTDQVWKQLAQATPALFNQNNTSQTPKHDQDTTYNFVPSTPLLEHGKDGIDAADLMTWGEIEGTPLLLDLGGDHTDFIFNIPDTPHREKLGMALSEEASKKFRLRTQAHQKDRSRSKPQTMTSTGYQIKSPMHRSAQLSAAGKKVLDRTTRSTSGKSKDIFGASFGSTPTFKMPDLSPYIKPRNESR